MGMMSGVEKKGVKTAGAAKVINGSKVLIMGLTYRECTGYEGISCEGDGTGA